jgi:hypothetical protein
MFVTQKYIYIKKIGSGVDQNSTFWTVAPLVDRRLRIRRSHRNATVLIFTCLIRWLDGSHTSSLISSNGCLGFLLKRTCIDTSLSESAASLLSCLPWSCCCLNSSRAGLEEANSIFFLLGIGSNPFSPGDPDFVLLIQQQL